MSRPLSGKVALVTGGSRGIGAAIARALAAQGADVALSYAASAERAEAVVRDLQAFGVRAIALQADQAEPVQASGLVERVVKEFGRLEILVNNAGVFVPGSLLEPVDPEAMARQFAVNVTGIAAAVRAAVKSMQPGGRIVTIGSGIADRTGFPNLADYSATKAALVGYTHGWARDLGPKQITVNLVQPGPIDTEMNPDQGEFADLLRKTTALGRYGKAEEVAAAVAFLVSPSASYITGATLNVDGGYLA